jgi:hypothetical protein
LWRDVLVRGWTDFPEVFFAAAIAGAAGTKEESASTAGKKVFMNG